MKPEDETLLSRLPGLVRSGFFPAVVVALSACGLAFPPHAAAQLARLVSAADPALAGPTWTTANGPTEFARFSADGRVLVFTSAASDLVTNDWNGSALDVFVRELDTGRTTLVSGTASGGSGNADSFAPDVSADGRYVVFASLASDLVSGDLNGVSDVFVRDRVTGETRRVSVGAGGMPSDGASSAPRISADGRWIAFASRASNLEAGVADADARMDVFLHDRVDGTTRLVSGEARGGGASDVQDLDLSGDGKWVAFTVASTNVVDAPVLEIATTAYVRDVAAGRTHRVEVPRSAMPAFTGVLEVTSLAFAPGGAPRLAVSGWTPRFVNATSNVVAVLDLAAAGPSVVAVVPGVSGSRLDATVPLSFSPDGGALAFVQTVTLGQPGIVRLWTAAAGVTNGAHPTTGQALRAHEVAVSPGGRRLAFTGPAAGLLPGGVPTNALTQVFVWDRDVGRLDLVTAGAGGGPAPGVESTGPVFAPDGRTLAFHTAAAGLVPGDGNGVSDLFLWDAVSGARTLVSGTASVGVPVSSTGVSSLMVRGVSGDGRRVLFSSLADDLVPDDRKGVWDLFVRDLLAGRTWRVTAADGEPGLPLTGGFTEAVMSLNGRLVVFLAEQSYERPDGGRSVGMGVYARDLATGLVRSLSVTPSGSPLPLRTASNLRVDAEGRYVAFHREFTSASGTVLKEVVRVDLVEGGTRVVAVLNANPVTQTLISLAGLGGRVICAHNRSTGTRITDFDPRTGVPEEFTEAPGTLVALSHDGRRRVLVVPGDAVTGPILRWKGPGVGEGGAFRPTPWGEGFLGSLEALSMDGKRLVLRRRGVLPAAYADSTFVVQVPTGEAYRLELDPAGAPVGPGAIRGSVSLSADGQWVAFQSPSAALAPDDPNDVSDIFLRRIPAGPTHRVARTPDSAVEREMAVRPLLSADGSVLVFASASGGFSAGDVNGRGDVFALAVDGGPAEDSDGDGLEDRWELAWFGNLDPDGTGDRDGDGVEDGAEYVAGTGPLDATDRFVVEVTSGGGVGVMQWQTRPGRRYRVQASGDLGGTWVAAGDAVTGDGAVARFPLPDLGGAARFFRIVVERARVP